MVFLSRDQLERIEKWPRHLISFITITVVCFLSGVFLLWASSTIYVQESMLDFFLVHFLRAVAVVIFPGVAIAAMLDHLNFMRKIRSEEHDEKRKAGDRRKPLRQKVRLFYYSNRDRYQHLLAMNAKERERWVDEEGDYGHVMNDWVRDLQHFSELRSQDDYRDVLGDLSDEVRGLINLWEARMKLYRYVYSKSGGPSRLKRDWSQRLEEKKVELIFTEQINELRAGLVGD